MEMIAQMKTSMDNFNTKFDNLDVKFNESNEQFTTKFDNLGSQFNESNEQFSTKFDNLDAKFNEGNEQLTQFNSKFDDLDAKISKNNEQINSKFHDLDLKFNDKLDNLKNKIDEQNAKLSEYEVKINIAEEKFCNVEETFVNLEGRLEDKLDEIKKQVSQEISVNLEGIFEGRLDEIKKQVNEEVNAEINNLVKQLNVTQTTKSRASQSEKELMMDNASVELDDLATPDEQKKGKIKLPVFDGLSSWSVYKVQLEAAASYNGWSTKEKAANLMLALRGQAASLLRTLPAGSMDLNAIMAALEQRYGDGHLQTVYRSQLKARVQRSGESLQEFAAGVEQLSQLAYVSAPTDIQQHLATQAFIDGLRDQEMRRTLLMGDHRTVSTALVQALTLEAAKKASHAVIPVRRIVTPSSEGDEARKTLKCWQCGELGHVRSHCLRGRKTIQCWTCGRTGHTSRSCEVSEEDAQQTSAAPKTSGN